MIACVLVEAYFVVNISILLSQQKIMIIYWEIAVTTPIFRPQIRKTNPIGRLQGVMGAVN
jgi:hypothetical protein